jgi:hypothetical protein
MSAFLVDPAHIDRIVEFAAAHEILPRVTSASDLGKLLCAANVDSMIARYGEDFDKNDDTNRSYTYTERAGSLLTAVAFLKALDCLEYQSCEIDYWEKSEAYDVITELRKRAVKFLPGYEAADWEITK